MLKIGLYGASGHGKVIKSVAQSNGIEVEAFFDDNPDAKLLQGIEVKNPKDLSLFNHSLLISIGNNAIRKRVSEQINKPFCRLIHKDTTIDPSVKIDKGTVVMPGCVVNSDAIIGQHTILNTSCVVEHDCVVSDFVHISPNATVAGTVEIGEGTHIGAGAIVIPNIKIGKWVTIGAGAVVINDIPDYAVAVGNPAKIIKYNIPR